MTNWKPARLTGLRGTKDISIDVDYSEDNGGMVRYKGKHYLRDCDRYITFETKGRPYTIAVCAFVEKR